MTAFRLIVKPNLVVIGTFYPLEASFCIEIKRPQLDRMDPELQLDSG